jgi:hypothetical protein
MTDLDRLREFAAIAWIIGDREGCIRLHAIVDAIDELLAKLDKIEPVYGIDPSRPRPERRANA